MTEKAKYNRLTPSLVLQLAAPHTWVASIYPVLIAYCVSVHFSDYVSYVTTLVLLAISILLQSSVNTINDYFDFIKGADSDEDNVEVDDAVLVYNNVNPRSVKWLSFAFMVVAFLLGIYIIYISGVIPLVIALVGAVVVFLYSGGKTPISYLPIGEIVSGFVMGGLITFASFYALTLELDWLIFVWAIPAIVGIALIMLSNNISDIEKDKLSKRKTLCVLLGRKKSALLYKTLIAIWILSILCIVLFWFKGGIIILIFGLIIAYPTLKRLCSASFEPSQRVFVMAQICNLNIILNTFYCMAIVV